MNVYMVSNGYTGCCYVRLLLPAFHNGFNSDRPSVDAPLDDTAKVRADMMNADVVVFHRPEDRRYHDLAEMLKRDGKKVVMDNDDTFILDYHPLAQFTPDAVEVNIKKRGEAIIDFLKIADLVTTSTETLAKEYRKHNDNVVVLPNCVDPLDWDEPLKNDSKKVRIGIVGSAALEYDYEGIKDVLKDLNKRKDVQLVMFGLGDKEHRKNNPKIEKAFQDDYDFWDSLDIDHFQWCPMGDYPKKLNEAKLDMMLIPRKDNYFNRCKSNVKFLEASMCEIPVIAQSFDNGPYEEIKHGENGLKVRDNSDWMKQIEYLINNPDKRRIMGVKAKDYVLDNYNIEDKAELWESAYNKLYEN